VRTQPGSPASNLVGIKGWKEGVTREGGTTATFPVVPMHATPTNHIATNTHTHTHSRPAHGGLLGTPPATIHVNPLPLLPTYSATLPIQRHL